MMQWHALALGCFIFIYLAYQPLKGGSSFKKIFLMYFFIYKKCLALYYIIQHSDVTLERVCAWGQKNLHFISSLNINTQ